MINSTHRLRFASQIATRAAFLADGATKEDGQAREVLTARFLHVIGADAPASVGA